MTITISEVNDGFKTWAKGLGPVSNVDYREWLAEFGRRSDDTGRKIRYEYILSDGRVVSADSALKATNLDAYNRLQAKHANFRSESARADLFQELPVNVQDQIIADLNLLQYADKNGRLNCEALRRDLNATGHILSGMLIYWNPFNQMLLQAFDKAKRCN